MTDRLIIAINWCFDYRHHLDADEASLVETLYGRWRKYGKRIRVSREQKEALRRCYAKIPRSADQAIGPKKKEPIAP